MSEVSELVERCVWKPDDDCVYATGCGRHWYFPDGSPEDNGVKFCHECGKPVEVAALAGEAVTDAIERLDSVAEDLEDATAIGRGMLVNWDDHTRAAARRIREVIAALARGTKP